MDRKQYSIQHTTNRKAHKCMSFYRSHAAEQFIRDFALAFAMLIDNTDAEMPFYAKKV